MAALAATMLAILLVLVFSPPYAASSSFGRRLDAGQGGPFERVPSETGFRRQLQQAAIQINPTVVKSFAEFTQALANGEDIEIRSHIDARSDSALPQLQETTRSIRGNCTGDLSDEMKSYVDSDLPLGQCMILAYAKQGSPVITVTAHTWIDNIYFVEGTIPAPNVQVGAVIYVKEPVGQIWVTQSTIQGAQQVDGVSLNQKGLQIRGSAYLSGTRLRRLGGTEPVIEIGPNQVNEPYVSLSNVLFDQNYGPIGDGSQFGGTDALIFINSGNLRMEDSSFPQNPHKYAVAVKDPASRVYAQPQVSVQLPAGNNTVTQPSLSLGEIPANATLFPSERSPLYVAYEQALPSRPAPRATDAPEDTSTGLSQGAHGATTGDTLHNLPDGDTAVAPADVWEVSTAQQLADGVKLGYRDIVVKAHLDMSAIASGDLGFVLTLLPSTRSIQGKCDGNTTIPASMANTPNPPGDVPAGTCVLGAEEGLLRLPSSNHFFYMNSIHLHAIPVPPGTTYIDDQTGAENPTTGPNTKWSRRFLEVSGSGSLVFLENIRMFGDEKGTAAVMLSDASAAMHIEDSTFQSMNVAKSSNAILRTRGALSLSNCALNQLTAANATSAIVLAEHSGSLTLQTQPPSQQCTGTVYALADHAAVYADVVPGGDQVLNINSEPAEQVNPSAAPADTTAALSLNHPWLQALKASLEKPQAVEDVSQDDGDYSYDLEADGELTDSLPSDTVKGNAVQLDPPADVRSVGTADELVRALQQSVLDIVISKHIDLRDLNKDMLSFLLTVGMNTRSIRGGECGAVDGWSEGQNLEPPISGVTTGQCVLLSDFGVFHVFSHNHNIWFDQIFVRFVAPPDGNESLQRDAFMISGQGSTAFMTGITVQGSGAQQPADSIGEGVLVIATNSSGAHMHEALFQDMRVLNADNSFIKTAGHLSLNNTQFQNVAAPDQKALIFVQATGKLRLAKVQFGPDASGTQVFVEGNTPNVWSEDPTQKVRDSITGQEATAPRLAAIPTPSPFTSLSNKWLQTLIVGLKQDEDSPFVGLNPDEPGRAELFRTPAGKNGGDSSSGPKGGTIAAVTGSVAAIVLAAVAVVLSVRRYRAKRDNDVTANGAFRRAWVENSSFSVISEGHGKQGRDSNNGKSGKLNSNGSARSAGIPATLEGSTGMFSNGIFGMFRSNKKQKTDEPAPKLRHVPTTLGHKHDSLGLQNNAALSVPLQPLVKALDALCAEKTFFLDVYVALGPASRKIGRDAVVQIFQHRMNKTRVAVKFYRTRATFDRERALRTNGDLSPICVPKIRTLADPGIGPGGYTWPPCIVLECGVNLVTYLNHVEQNDGEGSAYPVACAVVAELAELVELMHEVGFAHRKLRPENVMYIPERDAWSLTDIDRATRVGLMNAPAPPTEYTAPEVWKAMTLARTCLTTAAADVWAVGALAFELSTGERVLLAGSTPKEAAMGLNQRAQAAADAGKLGTIKDVIMECLHEDPQMRPTAQSIVPVLEAETERARIDLKMLQRELAQLSEHAEGYTQARVFLLAVCKTPLLPHAARAKLQDPPEQQPTPTEFKSLIQQYCMALGPDTVTLPKGLPFRKERLDSLKDINAMLNTVLKTTKL